MTALYGKYKESGLTVGEVRKKIAKPKVTDMPVDLSFVDQFYDWVFRLKPTAVPAGCRPAIRFDGDRYSGRKPTAVPVQADRLFMM